MYVVTILSINGMVDKFTVKTQYLDEAGAFIMRFHNGLIKIIPLHQIKNIDISSLKGEDTDDL